MDYNFPMLEDMDKYQYEKYWLDKLDERQGDQFGEDNQQKYSYEQPIHN